MTKHMKTHIYNESMNEKCHICDKTFKLKKYLKQHLIHLIESHLLDIIEITGELLGALDQCIESLHQLFKQRMKTSRYEVKNKLKDIAGLRLLQCVLHINAYNLYN